MDAIQYELDPLCPATRYPDPQHACAIDRRLSVRLNGSTQQLRICGDRADAPSLIVVQAGPGLPLLPEVVSESGHMSVASWHPATSD